jgi:hypothetical protein
MKRWKSLPILGVAGLGLAATGELRAEPQAAPPAGNHPQPARASVSLGLRFGAGTAPFFTANFPLVRGHGFVSELSGSYRISQAVELGLAWPGAFVAVEQPAGAYVDEVTWGNPTVFATHGRTFELDDGRALRWFARFGLSVPLAEHGEPGALLSNRALAVASALEGWRNQEAYFPGRLSLTPSGGGDFAVFPWKFEASVRLPVLIEVSGADLPEDSETHSVGFVPVVHTGVGVHAASWLIPSLSADLVINAVPPAESAGSEIQTAQLVLRPALTFPLGRGVELAADFVAPIAGSLGGSTFSGSLHLTKHW